MPRAQARPLLSPSTRRSSAPADVTAQPEPAFPHRLRPSEVLAEAKFFSLQGKRQSSGAKDQAAMRPRLPPSDIPIDVEIARALEKHAAAALAKVRDNAPQPQQRASPPQTWPPQKLSLALQGGGSFGAFTWGVLERLLEEPRLRDRLRSPAPASARSTPRCSPAGWCKAAAKAHESCSRRFWQRMTNETSFRSLMLIGGFSPAGSSVAFGPTLRSGQFDPFDLDPLREALARDIDFAALRSPACPQLLVAATRVRDGRQQIFDNAAMSADVLLASTCPPLVHCAVEIEGEHYWDGGYGANPPLVRLVEEAASPDLLVVQVTPARDSFVPITAAAIDRRLDQITANAALHAELSALEWARERGLTPAKIHRIAAEDEIDGLAQRNPGDLGRGFIALLHGRGRAAADRWLRGTAPAKPIAVPDRGGPGSGRRLIYALSAASRKRAAASALASSP